MKYIVFLSTLIVGSHALAYDKIKDAILDGEADEVNHLLRVEPLTKEHKEKLLEVAHDTVRKLKEKTKTLFDSPWISAKLV